MIRHITASILVACLTAGTAPAMAQTVSDADAAGAVKNVIDGYVRPNFQSFETAAARSAAATSALCENPGAGTLEEARGAFRDSVLAFARVEFLRLGPLVEENRLDRLLFWPDRRGIALRQVQGAIGSEDASVTDLANLKQKSVALQGYTALEFLLYGTGADALADGEGGHRCKFAEAVALNIQNIAHTVNDAWQAPDGIARTWSEPGPDNDRFRDGEEVLGELVSIPSEAFELIRDQRVLPIAPEDEENPNPKKALFWRSGLTFPMIESSIDGLRAYFDAAGIADILPEDERWLAGSVQFEFENGQRTTRRLAIPVEQVVVDPETIDDVHYLAIVLKSLNTLVGQQITAAFGLIAGFSSLDGD